MENKNATLKKAIPWLLIVFGFYSLNILPYMAGLAFIILGIVMMIERRWPEKWGDEKEGGSVVSPY